MHSCRDGFFAFNASIEGFIDEIICAQRAVGGFKTIKEAVSNLPKKIISLEELINSSIKYGGENGNQPNFLSFSSDKIWEKSKS